MAGPCLIDQSTRFDCHKWSNNLCVDQVVGSLLQEIRDLRASTGRRVRDMEELRRHLKILVLDLYIAYKSRPFLYRGISRRPIDYQTPVSRYVKVSLSYRHLVQGVLDDLIALKYVKQFRGFFDRERNVGFRTRIRARRNLIGYLESFGVSPSDIYTVDRETIVLRNTDGEDAEYNDTDATHKMRSNLAKINEAIKRRRIRLYLPDADILDLSARLAHHEDEKQRGPIDYGRNSLHRVFNNSSSSVRTLNAGTVITG